jgi:multiple sugar transport system substrate-binding protein
MAGLCIALLCGVVACTRPVDDVTVVRFPGSALGREGELLQRQLGRFMAEHPDIRVESRRTPDAADQRHQLYVQWLMAGAPDPDVLQLDVIWTAEFAAAGWLLPLDGFAPETEDFFPAALDASRWRGSLYALPWFVDVGMLYWRDDLLASAPTTFAALEVAAQRALSEGRVSQGFVWQGARYEGLVTVFLEYLTGSGGAIMDDLGRVVVDSPAAVQALETMRREIDSGIVPREVLAWQEEPVRFAFQNGNALFMRNWPYAAALLESPEHSRVAGRFSVAAMPAQEGGRHAAALGGSLLAINAGSDEPEAAHAVIEFLTDPAQMRERAAHAGQLPARRSLFEGGRLEGPPAALLAHAVGVIESAKPRPVTPIYTELSSELQVRLHRALSGQVEPEQALAEAATAMRQLLARRGLDAG